MCVCVCMCSIFYKLLDEITAECEELMAQGVSGTGVGFDAPSVGRLGSHGSFPTHNPAPSALRSHMVKVRFGAKPALLNNWLSPSLYRCSALVINLLSLAKKFS